MIDGRSIKGLGDTTPLDKDFEFWKYEARQHTKVLNVKGVRTEGAENQVAGEDVSRIDESETPHVRPEFVVPKIKYTRESKGLKPTYRVFSKDRKTVPKPRINPYSILLKMIDPANDDEYLDQDLIDQSQKLRDSESVAHDMDSTTVSYHNREVKDRTNSYKGRQEVWGETSKMEFRLETSHLQQAAEDGFHGDEVLSVEQDDDISQNSESDILLGNIPNFDIGEDSGSQGGDENELEYPFSLLSTEDNIDEKEDELNAGYNRKVVRLSDIWSDFEDENDDLNDFDDNDFDKHSDAELVKEETADGEDPLRKFLNSRSGNRDSKQEGRVYKFNKAARKTEGVHSSKFELQHSGSLAPQHPASNLTLNQRSGNETETSAMREVLQIAYNLPKDRVLEDYMAPFMNKFSNIQANLILEALCGDGLTDQMLSFFRWMRLHDPCLWDSRSFSLLFTFLGRMGMPEQALVYFGMLPEDKQFRSVEVYNTLITCLTNCNRYDWLLVLLLVTQNIASYICQP